jgi:DNA-directed DNA polymerase III PolC
MGSLEWGTTRTGSASAYVKSEPMFLNCHSYFSFNYGIMSPEELLAYAKEKGISHLALTDINNTSGVLDFLRLAPKYGIHPSIGIDFRNRDEQLYVCVAKNNEGFRELNEYLSIHRISKKDFPTDAPIFQNCFVIYQWGKGMDRALRENEFMGLRHTDSSTYRFYGQYPPSKLAILATLSFRDNKDFNTHRLLRAIHHNALLSKLGKDQQGKLDDTAIQEDELKAHYLDYPDAISNTVHILNHTITFEFGKSKNKKVFGASEQADRDQLKELALEGLAYRYKEIDSKTKKRFESELKTIFDLGFTPYFLINWDIVRFALSKGFFYIGRGSGANSIIAYCLRITDVDPIELDLYFERFINPSRKNPPDFDIDFSHTDRDTVRDYIFAKYKGYVALVGSYSTFENKSCTREIGKVFGLPDHEISSLQNDQLNTRNLDEYGKLVLKYAARIQGLPNLLSVHACGILISDLPITYYTALELMPVGYPSTQFSMLEAEDVGLYKYDILSQRGLGHIKDAVELVKARTGKEIDIHRIHEFKEDKKMKAMLRKGDTIGCFYIESPAMRQLLRKLRVDDYLGLVAASSIIRPGVSSSGMMREYILRFRFPEKRKGAHPKLLEIMPDTFGVMVYQEDVLKVAHYYAGLTLEEADVMRRGMSGKFRSREEFQIIKDKFFSNCLEKNYPPDESKEIWRQVESFAGYSFAKGHSASYAVESYQSLYLRAYHPLEFMTGVLNNFGGFYSTEFYLHEAKMVGAKIELPCVNMSQLLARLEGSIIYMGFVLIKDLEKTTIENILRVREEGEYKSLEDFIKRVPVSLEQLRILIRIKAFRFTEKSSKELLWDAHMILGKVKKSIPKAELFETTKEPTELPELEYGKYEDALDEMQILNFPYTSPFTLLKKEFTGMVYAEELQEYLGNVVYMLGYYISIKRVHTILGQVMYFANFIDKRGHIFDTVHFPKAIEKYPFSGKGCYLIKGTVVEDFDVPSVEVSHMQRIAWAFTWEE